MTVPPNMPSKRKYGLFTLAVLLLLLGGTALFVGSDDFSIRSLGVLACLLSVYCVRISNIHSRSVSTSITTQRTKSKLATRVGRPVWVVSIILLPTLGLSFLCLYRDAIHGYQEVWPVYLFAGVAVVCALCWSYLVSRLL